MTDRIGPMSRLGAALISAAVFANLAIAPAALSAQSRQDPRPKADGTETIAAPLACYRRLPDLPAARYGGFGAYNPVTRQLVYAGGAEKRTSENTIVYHDLFALDLSKKGSTWERQPYGSGLGYTRQTDRGCREMASVKVSDRLWLSVFGKDGCDNGRVDRNGKGGDIVALDMGDALGRGPRWLPGGAQQLPAELAAKRGRLYRLFATYDSLRSRVIFGQGTFDSGSTQDTLDQVYAATQVGGKHHIRRLRPRGSVPKARYGSCAVYVHQPDRDVDGVLVFGGKTAGQRGETLNELWWLDFAERADGVWSDIGDRVVNMSDFGPRREGACAYDAESRVLFAWMGRASKDIPDGAKRSSGLWRLDLGQLSDPSQELRWQQLAPDDQAGLSGRRLIPSVYDPVDSRVFAIGGRNDLDELSDVWAIYPGVTPAACRRIDPFEAGVPGPPPTALAPYPSATVPGPPAPQPTQPLPGPSRTPRPDPGQPPEPSMEPPVIGEPSASSPERLYLPSLSLRNPG